MAAITVTRPYDPGPIQPVVLVNENLGILVQGDWWFYRVDHVEGIPPGRQGTQDLGAINDNASSGEVEITVARAQDGNLLHVRMMPLDNVELDVFSGRSTGGRHTMYSAKPRITPYSQNLDTYMSASTTFVFGNERSMYINAFNESGYNLAQSRIRFWGYRYRLDPLSSGVTRALRAHLRGDQVTGQAQELIKNIRVTLVPAEGRE